LAGVFEFLLTRVDGDKEGQRIEKGK